MGILSKCVICEAEIPISPDRRGPKSIYCVEHREALTPKQRASVKRMRNNHTPEEIRVVARAMFRGAQLEPGLLLALEIITDRQRSLATKREATGRRRISAEETALFDVGLRIRRRVELARSFPTRLQK